MEMSVSFLTVKIVRKLNVCDSLRAQYENIPTFLLTTTIYTNIKEWIQTRKTSGLLPKKPRSVGFLPPILNPEML